jgi:hypothetical protein
MGGSSETLACCWQKNWGAVEKRGDDGNQHLVKLSLRRGGRGAVLAAPHRGKEGGLVRPAGGAAGEGEE